MKLRKLFYLYITPRELSRSIKGQYYLSKHGLKQKTGSWSVTYCSLSPS